MQFSSASNAEEARDRFVFVEEDGSIRELTPEEAEHRATPFHPADGARPYIKASYKSRTPNGKVSGLLARKDVPDHLR